jgi:hypothetical protein
MPQDSLTPPPIPAHLMPVIKTWHLADDNGGFAPVLETELIANGFNVDSEVWSEETGWQEAIDVPKLAYLFENPLARESKYPPIVDLNQFYF